MKIGLTVIVLCIFLLTVFIPNSEKDLEDDASVHFTINGDDEERIYEYTIYNKDGRIVDAGSVERFAPTIGYISDDIIEIRFHAGTYANLCKYYSISQDIFSEEYWNPYLVDNGRIVHYDAGQLIIQDLFDPEVYYKVFERDIIITGPPLEIRFIDEGRALFIIYQRQCDGYELSETIYLTEGN